MSNRRKLLWALVVVVVLFLGTAFYFNTLPSADVAAALEVTEIPRDSPNNVPNPLPYNYLYITGSVANNGGAAAYNVGLHVVAYDADGVLEINLTAPLINGATYGADAATNAYVLANYGNSSLQLGNLLSGQNVTVEDGVFHEGVVSNWTVTPVWTSSP